VPAYPGFPGKEAINGYRLFHWRSSAPDRR